MLLLSKQQNLEVQGSLKLISLKNYNNSIMTQNAI